MKIKNKQGVFDKEKLTTWLLVYVTHKIAVSCFGKWWAKKELKGDITKQEQMNSKWLCVVNACMKQGYLTKF